MNNVVSFQPSNVEAYRSSTDAAGLCRDIVMATAQDIQGRKYVKVEGWQAIAIAHGCTASARGVERVEGGVRAIGEVRRMGDGAVIAEGEGFVGEDEATWYGGEITTRYGKKNLPKRPDYAIRAMAQTRAISRACRSAFAHVVVMIDASLSTTPAEEVPVGGFDNGDVIDGDFTGTVQPPKPKSQSREIFAALNEGMREAAKGTEADLGAWFTANADDVGSLPNDWKAQLRAEYHDHLQAIRARAADPFGLCVETPEGDDNADWMAWLDIVLAGIQGAPDAEQAKAAQTVNAAGLATAAGHIEGVTEWVAEAVEQRLATLQGEAA